MSKAQTAAGIVGNIILFVLCLVFSLFIVSFVFLTMDSIIEMNKNTEKILEIMEEGK